MRFSETITAEQFCDIQESVGFGRPKLLQTETAIKNSLYIVSVELDGEVVGMGRLIGDNSRIVYIQDLLIKPAYQKKGIGTEIINRLLNYIKCNALPNTTITVGLMSAKGKEDFYTKLGFRLRPNEKEGNGMMMNIKI